VREEFLKFLDFLARMELQKDEEWDLKKGKGSFPKKENPPLPLRHRVEKSFFQD